MSNIYEDYKTNIRVSRKIHRLLKDLKTEDETFNDVLIRILTENGYILKEETLKWKKGNLQDYIQNMKALRSRISF